MGKNICIVTNCRSGQTSTRKRNKKLGAKNKSVFKAPKDPKLLQQWRFGLTSLRRPLTEDSFVCEDHFDEGDVVKTYETRLSDGTSFRMNRGKPFLKADAVPSSSPGRDTRERIGDTAVGVKVEPAAKSPSDEERQRREVNGTITRKNEDEDRQNSTTDGVKSEPSGGDERCTVLAQDWNFEVLQSSYRNVVLPNCEWAATASKSGDFVTFMSVSDDEIFKRVQIFRDLNVKVLLDDIPIRIKGLTPPRCERDVVNIVRLIDGLNIRDNYKDAKRLIKECEFQIINFPIVNDMSDCR